MSSKFWEDRKAVDTYTNILLAEASRRIGWFNFADGITTQTKIMAGIRLNIPITDYEAKDLGLRYQNAKLYDQAVCEYEKASALFALFDIGREKLRLGFMETACVAFRAMARVLLAEQNTLQPPP